MSWLPKYTTSHLCYQATQHGWGSETFHSRCDHKIPTVIVVRVGQYIFGGFSDVAWTAGRSKFVYTSIDQTNDFCYYRVRDMP